jgi:N-acyl-D-aspartate/D-glutamate deacylase
MHDVVIRGGTLIDGTGAAGVVGDLAMDGDRIAVVGGRAGPGLREIDAAGMLVTPGWVDIHTHYDGQATWDPVLAPSSWNGATTILFGNCGVGFAPVRKEHRQSLIDLMEGVEDIPGIVLAEGLKWNWESFPEYLDALESLPRTIDVAAQIPHHPLRVYVMGERAIRREAATAADIAAMRALTREAMQAGAFGFTTSRSDQHKTTAGELVPGRYAEDIELLGIGAGLGDAGFGTFGMLSEFEDEAREFAWMRQLHRDTGRPLWFLLTDRAADPLRWRRLMALTHAARAEGAAISAQVAARQVGLILGLRTTLNPFTARPRFVALAGLDPAERLARLRDPTMRAAILAEPDSEALLARLPPLNRAIATRFERLFVLGDPPDYEPPPERSIAAMAAAAGVAPAAFAYDYLTGEDGGRMLFFPAVNYNNGDLAQVRDMMTDPASILGLSDGGAHCGVICDASMPTFALTHWVRDRARGPRLPLEWMVKRQTSDTAAYFGFADRGRLEVGLKADVNIIDLARLRLHHPELIHDLPAGGKRLVQRVEGYRATFVSGVAIFENGEETGARPGRLVRAREASAGRCPDLRPLPGPHP